MPSQQLVYEGSDLQALIQRVVDEHGPARIRPPERRRKGGIFGFFAREVYVITVDTDDVAADDEGAVGVERGVSAAVTEAHEALPAAAEESLVGAALEGLRARQAAGQLPGAPAAHGSSGSGSILGALIEGTEDELDLEVARTAPQATGDNVAASPARARPAKSFRDVLDEVSGSVGEEPGTYRPNLSRLQRGGRVVTPVKGAGAPVAEGPAVDAENTAADVVLAAAEAAVGDLVAEGPGTSGPAGEDSSVAPRTAAVAPAVSQAATGALSEAVHAQEDVPREGGAQVDAGATTSPLVLDTVSELLATGGIPRDLIEAMVAPFPATGVDSDVVATLEAVLGTLRGAGPVPQVAGALMAVVGMRRSKGLREVAEAVAREARCPEDEIAVAGASGGGRAAIGYRVRLPKKAAVLAPGWRRYHTGVLRVASPSFAADQTWTREMLAAVRPSCVWGVVPASAKTADIEHWVRAIGGVDALALTDTEATTTPAEILGLGIPIARLDGDPASAQRWAALLAQRITRR